MFARRLNKIFQVDAHSSRSFMHDLPQLRIDQRSLLVLEGDLQRVSGTASYRGQWAMSPIYQLQVPKYNGL
jgi:hypothetical protein